jgi:hypothetical protein
MCIAFSVLYLRIACVMCDVEKCVALTYLRVGSFKVAILQANDKSRRKRISVLREREYFLKDDDDDKK